MMLAIFWQTAQQHFLRHLEAVLQDGPVLAALPSQGVEF